MTDTLTQHHLAAEEVNDGSGPAIMLTQQEGIEDAHVVRVHPWQLRAVCEQFGIIASNPQVEKTIAILTRRIQLLNGRIQHLDNWLRTFSDSDHADLTYEMSYSGGTADMAEEFCAELTEILATPAPLSPLATALPVVAKPAASGNLF